MGNGASMQAQTALNSEAAKPLDARDVTNLEYAKIELINARRQAQFYRNQALPKYQVDTTGDGIPNAIGYDTNKNGIIDSLDTTMDGLIDTVVVKYGQKLYYVPANMVGTTIVVSSGGKIIVLVILPLPFGVGKPSLNKSSDPSLNSSLQG